MTGLDSRDRVNAETALTLIENVGAEWYTSAAFEELFGAALFLSRTGELPGFPMANLSVIYELRQSCVTIVQKLDWLFQRRLSGDLEVGLWFYFGASDILAFHIVLRSLFDSLALAITHIAPRKKVTPQSFGELRKHLAAGSQSGERMRTQLGRELSDVILSCYWFEEMRDVRDEIVHREAQTILFLDDQRILFQLHRQLQPRLQVPAVMYNENVVDWSLYSALVMSRLLVFLNAFAEAVFALTPELIEGRGSGAPRTSHPGYRALKEGILQLLASSRSEGR